MPRLFLAVPLSNRLKKRIAPEIRGLRKKLSDWQINWVEPKNLHVTLVFFGRVEAGQIETLQTEIAGAVSGFKPFRITTGKLSLEGRPLWMEIEAGQEKLKKLAGSLLEKLTPEGSLAEEHSFHSHLTLGRVKKRGKGNLPKSTQTFRWQVNQVVLYESRLSPKGPTYIPRLVFSLKK